MATLDIIKDPVTGNQYSRDTSAAGSTYAPYKGNTLLPNVDTSKPIEAAKLNTNPIPTPDPVKSSIAHDTLSANVGSVADSAFSTQQQAAQDAATAAAAPAPVQKNGLQSVLDKILSDSTALGKKGQRTLEIQNEEGVNTKKKAQTDLENQILSKTRAYDKQIQAVKDSNPTGQLESGQDIRVAQLERQKNSELADLAIQYKVAQDDYQGAFEIAQAKVDAEFEPLQNEIDTLKTYYQLAQNDMTESEKLQAQAVIQAKQDDKNFAQQKELAAINHKYQLDETAYTHSFDTPDDTGTEAERMAKKISQFSAAFSSGKPMADGTSVKDPNGFITPKAWKAAIEDATSRGIDRDTFISTFGNQLFTAGGKIPSSYGLTPKEQALITG